MRNLRILIVEDTAADEQVIRRILVKEFPGADITTIDTELKFREWAQDGSQTPADVIILDVMLPWTEPTPHMTAPPPGAEDTHSAGYRCLELVRRTPWLSNSVVILMTVLELKTPPDNTTYLSKQDRNAVGEVIRLMLRARDRSEPAHVTAVAHDRELRALIVEDIAEHADALRRCVIQCDPAARALTLSTEFEVTERFAEILEFAPDVILLDVMLPWCRPEQARSAPSAPGPFRQAGPRIKHLFDSDPRTSRIPVLVCSALAVESTQRDFGDSDNVHFPREKTIEAIKSLLQSVLAAENETFGQHQRLQRLFISYAHADSDWLNKIRPFVGSLEIQGRLSTWCDVDLHDGPWLPQIERELLEASAALFLASADFCNSAFVQTKELRWLLDRAHSGNVVVWWLAVRHCASLIHGTPLGRFQCLNDPHKPLHALQPHEQEQVLDTAMSKLLQSLQQQRWRSQ